VNQQIESLTARLQKGLAKTQQILGPLSPAQWQSAIYEEPRRWSIRDLLAHFVSAEEQLLLLAKQVAAGGGGVSLDFDFDAYNQEEQKRLAGLSPEELMSMLSTARQATLQWVQSLDEAHLQRSGRHPALGDVDLETMITAIYGHQLLHMRDVMAKLRPG